MIVWRSGTVTALGRRWRGAIELTATLDAAPGRGAVSGAHHPGRDAEQVRALAYPELVGAPQEGDRVLLNVTALSLGLGTGGYAHVVALPDRLPPDRASTGHAVKARYTPLQSVVLAVEEEASPHRDAIAANSDVDGMPVVVADLHSALPAILTGIHLERPGARVAYLMTDGGALPAWFSRTLDAVADQLVGVVTVGQAFGGDLEATTTHSGLLAARHVLHADVAVVSQGPGNLGTGTPWGFSGVAAGEAVNAAAALGGRPVGSLRISAADPRPRHRGLSHHTTTAYGRVALAAAELVLPDPLEPELAPMVHAALRPLRARHRVVSTSTEGLLEALRAQPAPLSTMGRGLDADTAYFLAAAAAGRHASQLLGG
ncbi:MAG: DUF3866 family protein [Micromonosporaceae bacterium]